MSKRLYDDILNNCVDNLKVKFNDLINLVQKISEKNSWIIITQDTKHSNSVGICVKNKDVIMSDSLIKRGRKLDPGCVRNFKKFIAMINKLPYYNCPFGI